MDIYFDDYGFTDQEKELIIENSKKGFELKASGRSVFYLVLDFQTGRKKSKEIYFSIDRERLKQIADVNNKIINDVNKT